MQIRMQVSIPSSPTTRDSVIGSPTTIFFCTHTLCATCKCECEKIGWRAENVSARGGREKIGWRAKNVSARGGRAQTYLLMHHSVVVWL